MLRIHNDRALADVVQRVADNQHFRRVNLSHCCPIERVAEDYHFSLLAGAFAQDEGDGLPDDTFAATAALNCAAAL